MIISYEKQAPDLALIVRDAVMLEGLISIKYFIIL